jgi:EF hand
MKVIPIASRLGKHRPRLINLAADPGEAFLASLLVALLAFGGPGIASAAEKEPAKKKSGFENLDTNNDGVVTLDEFVAGRKQNLGEEGARKEFAHIDANGDGKITLAEMRAAHVEKNKKKQAQQAPAEK